MAVGDMLALTLADVLHQDSIKAVFQKNHPGGAIGDKARRKIESVETDEQEEPGLKRHRCLASPPA